MKIRIHKTILLLALSVCLLNAQKNNGLAFLTIDVDARAAALAGAYTALTSDASAAYWNPAGLALAKEKNFNGMYNDMFAGIAHGFVAAQISSGEHAMALSFNYQNVPGIEIREGSTDLPAGVVNTFSLAAAFSYATTYDEWHVGGSLKYLFEKLYLASAPGWAIDLGVLKKNFLGSVDFGLAIQNLGKMSKMDHQATKLPLMISTGLTYRIPSFFDDDLLVSSDIQWVRDQKIYMKLGVQYYLTEYFVLRSGIRNGNEDLLWAGGFGIHYNAFRLDYAYAPLEFDLGSNNRFSLGINF